MEKYWIRKDIEMKLLLEGIIAEYGIKDIPGFSGSALLYNARGRLGGKVPLLTRISDNLAQIPNKFYIAQLGAVCATLGAKVGYIFNFPTNLKAGVLWNLKFDNLSDVRSEFIRLIEKMIKLPIRDEL